MAPQRQFSGPSTVPTIVFMLVLSEAVLVLDTSLRVVLTQGFLASEAVAWHCFAIQAQ